MGETREAVSSLVPEGITTGQQTVSQLTQFSTRAIYESGSQCKRTYPRRIARLGRPRAMIAFDIPKAMALSFLKFKERQNI